MLARKFSRAKGVMMFSSTCHNELEEMSRDGSSWLAVKKWCGDGALSAERTWRDRSLGRTQERDGFTITIRIHIESMESSWYALNSGNLKSVGGEQSEYSPEVLG
jgi:hypothetical protein